MQLKIVINMDGLIETDLDFALLDTTSIDTDDTANWNTTNGFNDTLSLFIEDWAFDSFSIFDDEEEEPPTPNPSPEPGPDPFNDPNYEVIVNGTIIPQFDMGNYVIQALAGHFTGEGGFSATDVWFMQHGMLPIPDTFFEDLALEIELSMVEMMTAIYGQVVPQLIALGVMVPASVAILAEQMEALTDAMNALTEQLGETSDTADSNAATLEAMQDSIASVLNALDSTAALLTSLQEGLNQNDPTFIEISRNINYINQARDSVRAMVLMGIFGQ